MIVFKEGVTLESLATECSEEQKEVLNDILFKWCRNGTIKEIKDDAIMVFPQTIHGVTFYTKEGTYHSLRDKTRPNSSICQN